MITGIFGIEESLAELLHEAERSGGRRALKD
jgi:hypothetical protein